MAIYLPLYLEWEAVASFYRTGSCTTASGCWNSQAAFMQVGSAYNLWSENLVDTTVLSSFVNQCNLYPPQAFLNYMASQLTADGDHLSNLS